MAGRLLTAGRPLVFDPELAAVLGLNEAIVLQQVHYWLCINRDKKRAFKDGFYWVFASYPEWNKQFPFWSESTIKTTFQRLEAKGILVSANYNSAKYDRTKWYRISYETLSKLIPSVDFAPMEQVDTNRPIQENKLRDLIKTEERSMETFSASSSEGNNKQSESKKEAMNEDSGKMMEQSMPDTPTLQGPMPEIDPEIIAFMNWYIQRYSVVFGLEHPPLKSEQMMQIHYTLEAFMAEYDVNIEDLCDMALNFLHQCFQQIIDGDGHIWLFVQPGILENRYYESIFNK